jgi:hypothetical protein
MLLPLYLRGKSPQYPSNRRLGEPLLKNKLLTPAGNRIAAVQPLAQRYTD